MRCSLFLAVALALGGTLSAIPVDAQAQSRRQVQQTAEGSMVLTGEIDIGTEGQVEGFVMDQRDKVAADLAGFVERSVQGWRFEPVVRDGKPVRARTFVNIRLGAKAGPEGNDIVTLQAASFGKYDPEATDEVQKLKIQPPIYPTAALDRGGQGEVVLILKVGRDGKVLDSVAEQVNLRVFGDESQMNKLREVFARQSVNTSRRWTFRPPTTGKLVDEPFWSVRVPVNFAFTDSTVGYGQWTVFIPGPRNAAPWRENVAGEADVGGLLMNGGVYTADLNKGPRLLTQLGG